MTEKQQHLIAFGPVPSRRLGRSLGINNIPPKSCSYSCVYCQVGPTVQHEIEPRVFYGPETVAEAVTRQVVAARRAREAIDYLTFVPDGEPTLDINLGKTIELLRPLGIRIAVISNASLIWRKDVRDALDKADWVSLKVDAVDDHIWRQINQPHPELHLDAILDGIRLFAARYQGALTTETMLVAGINDKPEMLEHVADFLAAVNPHVAYLAIPTRPPAQADVRAPSDDTIVGAYEILADKLDNVEYLIGYESDSFALTGDPERDLLAITAVHPMRAEAVANLLEKAGCNWSLVEQLIKRGKIREVRFAGRRFFLRRPESGQ
jgi:wyosine [tRNA(Phe)-imidazoG37] synthetase (radical SAM superfamily)